MIPTPRAVIAQKFIKRKSGKNHYESCNAVFHGFSTDYEEFDNGIGNYSVAIIEWPDGKVETVQADLIQFVNPTVIPNSSDAP
jgi:hypothetical protein